ncbi:MAG: dockerin type I repeat-containing protein [Oscillospiraceae bacterium]|nr:dockerin type I repeat-containing protein [Oscillospiraceae bacterium]
MKKKLIAGLASLALLATSTPSMLSANAELVKFWYHDNKYNFSYGCCPHGIYYTGSSDFMAWAGDGMIRPGTIWYGERLETFALYAEYSDDIDMSTKVGIGIWIGNTFDDAIIEAEAERVMELPGFECVERQSYCCITAITTIEQALNFPADENLGYEIGLLSYPMTDEEQAEKEEAKHKIYETDPTPGEEILSGDANGDGEVGVMDVVLLQKWLLGIGELPNWKNADLHKDGVINIYDLLKLKQMLIELL